MSMKTTLRVKPSMLVLAISVRYKLSTAFGKEI
jgi:hypothetical protein